MSKKFDRADTGARALRAAYKELGVMLSDEAVDLRAEIHEQFYPSFGFVVGQQRRFLQRRSRQWDDLFRDLAQRLFQYSAEVEEKVVYSLAVERQAELQDVLERIRKRKSEADQLIRAISWRMRQYLAGEELDTESVYDFCLQVEQAAQFFQFTSLVLLQSRIRNTQAAHDPQFKDLDWDELEQIGALLPKQIRGELKAAPMHAALPPPPPPPPPQPQRALPPPPVSSAAPPPPVAQRAAETYAPPPPPPARDLAPASIEPSADRPTPATPTIDAPPTPPPTAAPIAAPPPPPLGRPRPAAPARDSAEESLARPPRPPRAPRE
jgi:hypothetical protein